MKIIVNPHKCEIDKTPVNEKEINVSKCEFVFSEEIPSGYVKEAYFTYNGTTYKQILFNNECDFPPEVLEKKGQVEIGIVVYETTDEQYIKRFNPSPVYFETWQGSLKDEFENSEEITPTDKEQIIGALNDGLDRIDSAVENVNTAIEETNNLDVDVSKEGKVATVTLTKKDATTKTITLSDGTSLMFNWDGTKLGIKTDEDTEYTYVDLQGVQGPIGPKGEAFTIKKTYSSVAEMNADFNNMQLGDYVMIASTVEVEDNAKLYTRGESQWIFISDFSGAQGIKGETGATPNIQIGTVISGENPSVTRTGTNENPILNFTLVKGDKGDTGNTGPTGATGNGIASITKTSTSGLVDTYTITYTDGTTTTFQITNGEDGEVTETELNIVKTDVDDLRRNQLMNTETGTNINVDDAFDTRIMESKMSKESTQDGTPTPENPVEVKTVKGYRNLFDKTGTHIDNYVNVTELTTGIRVTCLNDYTNISTKYVVCDLTGYEGKTIKAYCHSKSSASNKGMIFLRITDQDGNSTSSFSPQVSSETLNGDISATIEIPSVLDNTYHYLILCLYGTRATTPSVGDYVDYTNLMLVVGEETLPYVPYGTNWVYTKVTNGTDTNYYTIPLNDNEIAGIGDYKDEYIIDKNGHCWLNKKIGKKILNGTETIEIVNSGTPNWRYDIAASLNTPTNNTSKNSICSHYPAANISNTNTNQGYLIIASNGSIRIRYGTEDTVSNFKSWLSNNNVSIYYLLLTPELIDLNYDVDIRLFNGVNNISNSDDMDMEIKYVQDINTILDKLINGQAL